MPPAPPLQLIITHNFFLTFRKMIFAINSPSLFLGKGQGMGKKDADPKNDSGIFLTFLSKNGIRSIFSGNYKLQIALRLSFPHALSGNPR